MILNMFKNLTLNYTNFILFLFFSLISFLIISFSPQILGTYQPDSNDFLEASDTRKHLYPFFIKIIEKINLNLLQCQKLLLSISIIFFCYSISILYGFKIGLVCFFLVIFNFYYTSFSKVILVESLFFSMINFLVGLILLKKVNYKFFLIGVLAGSIFSLKMSGIFLSMILIIFYLIFIHEKEKFFLTFTIGFFLIVLCENYLFYSKYDKRNSVFYNTVVGKLYFLSGKKSFEIESYPNMLHSELTVSKKTFSQVHSFLDNIKNPILRSDLSADYEVVAQMQMKNIFEENNVISQNNYLKRNLYMVLFTILLNNPLDYFKLALSHFIGLWSTGFKFVYFENLNNKELNKIPYYNNLLNSSGDIKIPNTYTLYFTQIFFLILLLNLIVLSFDIVMKLSKKRKIQHEKAFLILSINFYLIFISFINIATIRYLMPVYPLIILIFSLTIRDIIENIYSKKK
jgi:hypothetical protein